MMLLAIHIVAIGIVVGVTAYFAYNLGIKHGLGSDSKEQGENVHIEASEGIERI